MHYPTPPPQLYLTGDHSCGYLPPRQARNLVVEPGRVRQDTYNELIQLGFRRSGTYLYRPHCRNCQACQSLRVAATEFSPDRTQRRVMMRNRDLILRIRSFQFDSEHYRLFERYVRTRHPGGGMDQTSPAAYCDFLACSWCSTRLWEFRHGGQLIGAAVVDHLDNALSAVYTYYDTVQLQRSLGTYAILCQLEHARRHGLPWVYLGYQIDGCQRMAYKGRFRPHQRFCNGHWRNSRE